MVCTKRFLWFIVDFVELLGLIWVLSGVQTMLLAQQLSLPSWPRTGAETTTTTPLESLLPELVTQPPNDGVDDETSSNYCFVPVVALTKIGDEELYHEASAIVDMVVTFLDAHG